MASWLGAVKNFLSYYLGTQDNKYILTEAGFLLWITDHDYNNYEKF